MEPRLQWEEASREHIDDCDGEGRLARALAWKAQSREHMRPAP